MDLLKKCLLTWSQSFLTSNTTESDQGGSIPVIQKSRLLFLKFSFRIYCIVWLLIFSSSVRHLIFDLNVPRYTFCPHLYLFSVFFFFCYPLLGVSCTSLKRILHWKAADFYSMLPINQLELMIYFHFYQSYSKTWC